jgi:hypothetical protein
MSEAGTPTRRDRLATEAKEFAALALYLFVCFAALYNLKAAVLAEEGIAFAPLAVAAVKAVILAKFVLLGKAMHLGEGVDGGPLAVVVLRRSLLFLLLLTVLSAVEHAVTGLVHGTGALAALRETVSGRAWEVMASSVLLWLVLMPYLGLQHIAARLGDTQWRRILAGDR